MAFAQFLTSQNVINIDAKLDVPSKSLTIEQQIIYQNTSNDTLKTIYLNDWNNAYSTKKTPLAKRFEMEFSTKFHFAKSEQRGFTVVTSILSEQNDSLNFNYLKEHPDVIEVHLKKPLLPGTSYNINLSYLSVVPDATFTDYGIDKNNTFNLKYWYILPALYDGEWHYYSNKNLDDLLIPKADIFINMQHPRNYTVVSELDVVNFLPDGPIQTTSLFGKDRTDTFMVIGTYPNYKFVQTDQFTIISNITEKGLKPEEKAIYTDKIVRFLTDNLGSYPHQKLVVSNLAYTRDPLYGLNQLPDFIKVFPDNFQYELKLLKTALKKYIDNILLMHPRNDYWLSEGLQIYYMMKYVEINYPDTKLMGTLSNIWGVRSFNVAKVDFNFQYYLFFMEMARKNNDQPLSMPKDQLIKFNANIANKYKAGLGLKYLDEFINADVFEKTVGEFLGNKKLQYTTSKEFESLLKQKTTKDIDWFFKDYIQTRKKIDFKFEDVITTEDSIIITIKNKRNHAVPARLRAFQKDSVKQSIWIENIKGSKTISIARDSIDNLVLNEDNVLPEFNRRDNYHKINSFFASRKPFQVRLFKDLEDPKYNQVFMMPLVEFGNIYDGLTLGAKLYNKTLLRRRLNYRFSPQYATNSNTLTGSASVFYTHNIENRDLFDISYGLSANYRSFAQDAFFTTFTPQLSFTFRKDSDFRDDMTQQVSLRYVNIRRRLGPDAIVELDEPDYGVLNLRYVLRNPGLINYNRLYGDFQIADNFSKIAVNYEYRKLFENNQQFSFRFFAGAFLYNNTAGDSNFFSFALDRPTDYLFDFPYLGRSEDSGIFSQQLIIAEGGFKSKLATPFANQWMTTANFSASIWRYIQAYGDVGLVKNKFDATKFVYDSGIRLVLVEDYFEIFFPVYSSLGWELGQQDYDQRIRFMFTVDPQVLLGLFRRKWY